MTAIDPVCGMEVDTETAEWTAEYQGQTYYFCAPSCRRTFQLSPAKYAEGSAQGQGGHDHAHPHDSEHQH